MSREDYVCACNTLHTDKNSGVLGIEILKWMLKTWDGRVWTGLIQDWHKQWTVVSNVMNLWFHIMWGIPSLAKDLLASGEGLCSMELVGCLVV